MADSKTKKKRLNNGPYNKPQGVLAAQNLKSVGRLFSDGSVRETSKLAIRAIEDYTLV